MYCSDGHVTKLLEFLTKQQVIEIAAALGLDGWVSCPVTQRILWPR